MSPLQKGLPGSLSLKGDSLISAIPFFIIFPSFVFFKALNHSQKLSCLFMCLSHLDCLPPPLSGRLHMRAKTVSVPLTLISPEANSARGGPQIFVKRRNILCYFTCHQLVNWTHHFMSIAFCFKKPLLTLTFLSHTGLPGLQHSFVKHPY